MLPGPRNIWSFTLQPGDDAAHAFLSYLYNLSERQTEVYVNKNLPAKYFVGLAVDQKAPDHSSMTKFRERLLKNGKLMIFKAILAEIVQIAIESSLKFGSIQIMDSVHSVANVNTGKDEGRKKRGKGHRDPDAKWGTKHTRKVKTDEGKTLTQRQCFYGYKAHVSMNAENNLITSVIATSGEAYDGHLLPGLLERDLAQGMPLDTVAADRGYDDGANHYLVQSKGLHSAIHGKKTGLHRFLCGWENCFAYSVGLCLTNSIGGYDIRS